MGISQTKIELLHPYCPREVAIPGYVENSLSVSTLLATFATAEAVLLTSTYFAVKRWRPSITPPDLLTVLWFVLCMLNRNIPLATVSNRGAYVQVEAYTSSSRVSSFSTTARSHPLRASPRSYGKNMPSATRDI
jgi:hypothetical protein